MHELSIAQAVVRTVLETVPGAGDGAVEAVEVTVGDLSGVAASALELGWQAATSGTPLAGAELLVRPVPTTVFCARCDEVVTPDVGLACPACGEPSGDVRSGRELDVTAVRLRDEAQP